MSSAFLNLSEIRTEKVLPFSFSETPVRGESLPGEGNDSHDQIWAKSLKRSSSRLSRHASSSSSAPNFSLPPPPPPYKKDSAESQTDFLNVRSCFFSFFFFVFFRKVKYFQFHASASNNLGLAFASVVVRKVEMIVSMKNVRCMKNLTTYQVLLLR